MPQKRWIGSILIVIAAVAHAQTAPIVNPGFQEDGGFFQIPSGWTPFGDCKFEGGWEGDWDARIADVQPQHEAGLYQVVRVTPGHRYQLSVEAKGGHEHLEMKAGLIRTRSANLSEAVWSASYSQTSWQTLSVEQTATGSSMTIVLHVRNNNPDWTLLEAVSWDNCSLDSVAPGPSPTPTPAGPTPTFAPPSDVYGSLANLWSLALPKPGVRTFLAGTHDPDGNADFDRVEGEVDDGGETWTVLKTLSGPGAICRIWMTNFRFEGLIRIYVDGVRVVDAPIRDFFGNHGDFRWPLATRSSGGWASYIPIPFSASARVQVRNAEQYRFYWQITYQRFDSAPALRPFTQPLHPTDGLLLDTIQDQWGVATLNPKPELPGTEDSQGTVRVPASGSSVLWSQEGPGIIDALWIKAPSSEQAVLQNLFIEATWDEEASPQVSAPLGLFFGAGNGGRVVRGLMIGMTPLDGGYCYFPMPYRSGARIALRNTGDQAADGVEFRVRYAPLTRSLSPMRFFATPYHENPAGPGRLYVPLETEGSGHFVGGSHALARGNGEGFHFLEGDEYIWVDHEAEPSTAGTGTEDYFTCGWYFQSGPITLPAYGAPEVDRGAFRVSAYRLHLPDWVPFSESLRFGLEVGNHATSTETGDYTTVCYYYLQVEEPIKNPALILGR